MKYAVLLAFAALPLVIACGGDDGDDSGLAEELGEVCEQRESADTERISVSNPEAGDEVSSPLTVTGEIDTADNEFWISAVNADGEHIIDYPARSEDYVDGEMSPFDVSVPFTIGEEAPVCVWVYRVNVQGVETQEEAVRIPVRFLPNETPGPSE
jgi:hypothetical protein